MYVYKIRFLGGCYIQIRANSPKQAWERASETYVGMEVVAVQYLR